MSMIIFLDIDGVIATRNSYKKHDDRLDRACIKQLNRLALATDARIVISSTWRLLHDLNWIEKTLRKAGLNPKVRVIGVTPSVREPVGESKEIVPHGRDTEILRWMETTKYTGDYLAIDDDSYDMGKLPRERFLHIKEGMNDGLTEALVTSYLKGKGKRA